MAKLQLPDVTLIIIDTQCHELAQLAVEDSMHEIDFGDAIIFSDKEIPVQGTRWVQVPGWPSIQLCCEFVWYELYKYVKTSHWMIVQWDGWIIDTGCWRPEFMDTTTSARRGGTTTPGTSVMAPVFARSG